MPMIFQVSLETVSNLSSKQPYNQTEGANFKLTRSTWFPDFLRDNRELKDGDQITATGTQALYLLNNFTQGYGHNPTSPYNFLTFISGTTF